MKRILILTIAVILSVGSLGYRSAFAADKPIVLRLAHLTVAGGMMDKEAQKFAELLSQKTKGQVKVDVYPAAQLGNITELLEGVSMGSIDMVMENPDFLGMFEKDVNFFSAPFALSREKYMNSEYFSEICEKLRKKNNIRVLPGWGWRPPMHLFTQKRIIKTPDELQGIKLRLWQQKVQIDVWNGLGSTAVPLPWSEVYMALAQGVVNGIPHNIVQIYEEKFHEQLNYCTYLDYMPVTNKFVINDPLYNKLSADIKKAIDESSTEAGKYFTEMSKTTEDSSKKEMEKKGIKFIETDRKIWVEKALSVLRKLENEGAWSKGLLKKAGLE